MDFKLFKQIADFPGISGREDAAREGIIKLLKPLTDEIKVDAMGNIIALKKGKGSKKLLLSAHMDEVGFAVKFIENDGFIRFIPIGGIDARILPTQRVIVHTASGPLKGVIGTRPVHLLAAGEAEKTPPVKTMFIDLGLDKKTVEQKVSIGDMITFDADAEELGSDMIIAKAIDDRLGVYIIVETLKNIKNPDCDIHAVITVQEEVGLRGAGVSAFGVDPDIALIVDPTAASDIPGTGPADYNTQINKGAVINMIDGGTIAHPKLVSTLKKLAEDNNIPYQVRIADKGTNDAGAVQRSRAGVIAGSVAVPCRYIHTPTCVSSKHDIDAAIKLVGLFAENCAKADFNY
ncbi:endoglucanase [Parelusimicrobium proximum]|uniref:M42 family metallopeptidase n=1 Tax=Parelusimicrobium proximum TaxID=3228953 RepID=UPI003D17941D